MKSLSRIIALSVLLICAYTALSQQPKPEAPKAAEKAPVIPADTIKRFWQVDDAQQRAQRQLEQAQAQAQAASQNWQAVLKELTSACGDKYQIAQDAVGTDPYCKPKPAEAPKK